MRVACLYRTVSEDAALVVAGTIPIDLLAQERKEIYLQSSELGLVDAAEQVRERTIGRWQQRWDASPKGPWARLLIQDLGQWSSRRQGKVTFYLTQFQTGHWYFRKYLFRMRKVGSPHCLLCSAAEDDVLHTFFVCDYFADERRGVERAIADSITPENFVG
ncbi:uncharacterized protein LOC114881865 [Osmia bicornis bicornis]|uniref:uncharacterized protein LOC114881865 n=1 Tax=Osmia bicornis bicornis TaxID=1437191 RepID=UPI001EAECCEA|nr:uncharacterized protein LOC114881865 [Osmia bicornis bicornis]